MWNQIIFDTRQNKKIVFARESVIFIKNLSIDRFGGRNFSVQQNLQHLEI